MKTFFTLIAVAAMASTNAFAQSDPFSGAAKQLYTMIKGNLVKAAEKMPEEDYSFKPTPDVRSFGELIGHVADAQITFCAAAAGDADKKPAGAEKTKKAKADLVAALKDSVSYCDTVYNSMTDAKAAEKVKFFGNDTVRLGLLNFNVAHDNEHYGNIVTYMRLKGLVPPSSERQSR